VAEKYKNSGDDVESFLTSEKMDPEGKEYFNSALNLIVMQWHIQTN
jgi:hypothetical protein